MCCFQYAHVYRAGLHSFSLFAVRVLTALFAILCGISVSNAKIKAEYTEKVRIKESKIN